MLLFHDNMEINFPTQEGALTTEVPRNNINTECNTFINMKITYKTKTTTKC